MQDDLLQNPDLVLRRQGRSNGRAEPTDQLLPLGDLVPGSPDQVNEFQPGAGPIAALAASLDTCHEPPGIKLHALKGVCQVMLEPFKRNHAYAVALPIALALFGDLLVESLELVKIADEVLGRRQLVQAWKRAGEKCPVFGGQLRIDPIEPLDRRFTQRALGGFGDRARDPSMLLALGGDSPGALGRKDLLAVKFHAPILEQRSEEHTSELQSHHDLVCRLLLEKKKKKKNKRKQKKKN